LFIFKIPALGTDFQNTGLLPASTKLAVKCRPGRWKTGHLTTLLPVAVNNPVPARQVGFQQFRAI